MDELRDALVEYAFDFLDELGTDDDAKSVKFVAVKKLLVGAGLLYMLTQKTEDFEGILQELARGVEHCRPDEVDVSFPHFSEELNPTECINFSILTAAAIVKLENARLLYKKGEYEDAFLEFTMGWHYIFLLDSEAWFALPSNPKYLERTAAQDILDEIRTDTYRTKVKDWGGLIRALDEFKFYPKGKHEEKPEYEHVRRRVGYIEWEDDVVYKSSTDSSKRGIEFINYLELIKFFMLGQMSLQEFSIQLQEERDKSHQRRLERDFFYGIWDNFAKSTRKCLVQMESCWYDASKQGGRGDAAANELRHAFIAELKSLLFNQVRPIIERILADKQLRKELGISPKASASSLDLQNMAILLEKAGEKDCHRVLSFKEFVESLIKSDRDREFLYKELPDYLRELAEERAEKEHPGAKREKGSSLTRKMGEQKDIWELRSEALGIGRPSYLRRLVEIKKKWYPKVKFRVDRRSRLSRVGAQGLAPLPY